MNSHKIVITSLVLFAALTVGCSNNLSDTTQSSTPTDVNDISQPDTSSSSQVAVQDTAQLESLWYYYNLLDASGKEVYLELYHAIQDWIRSDSDIRPFSYDAVGRGSGVDGNDILMYLKWDNPLISQYFNTITVNENDGFIVFTDTDDQQTFGDAQTVRQLIHEIEEAADAFLSKLDSSMSDYDKYWYIAKRLCDETMFDYTFPQVPVRQFLDDSGVYGALVSHQAVCQGFSETYDFLCKRAGLFSLVVSGHTSVGDHAWNIIKLDDGYYHVDTTWMQSNENRYFCLTDQQIFVDHTMISEHYLSCEGSRYAYQGSLD